MNIKRLGAISKWQGQDHLAAVQNTLICMEISPKVKFDLDFDHFMFVKVKRFRLYDDFMIILYKYAT